MQRRQLLKVLLSFLGSSALTMTPSNGYSALARRTIIETNRDQNTPQTLYLTDLREFAEASDWTNAIKYINENATNNMTVVIPPGEYFTNVGLRLVKGMHVLGTGGKVILKSSAINESAIVMADDSSVTGILTIDLEDTSGANWRRAHITIGEYDTGIGRSNIKIAGIEILGGHDDANGLFITGDSHDIDIRDIAVPDNSHIGRIILAHWGGSNYHNHNADGSELHIPGKFTTHPHNITISNISTGAMSYSYGTNNRGNCAIVFFSAAYKCKAENINSIRCQQVAVIYGSDFGFTYAHDDIKKTGQRDIHVDNVKCKLVDYRALTIDGQPNYTNELIESSSTFNDWVVYGNRLDKYNSSGIVIEFASDIFLTNIYLNSFKKKGILISEGCSNISAQAKINNTNENAVAILGTNKNKTSRIKINIETTNSNTDNSTSPETSSAVYISKNVSTVEIEGKIGDMTQVNNYTHGVYKNDAINITIKAAIGKATNDSN